MIPAVRALLAAASATASIACLAASFGGVEVPPPLPPKPVTDTHHGTAVPDPYRFLEDVKDPAIQAWMKAQADAATAILGKLPGRARLLARIEELGSSSPGLTSNAVRVASGRYFFLKRDPTDLQYRLVYRDGAAGSDRLVIDPAQLQKKTGIPHAIMDFAPSPDGRRVAYSIQAGGGEIGTLHVVDLATGKELAGPIDRIRYAVPTWLDDGSGLFYSRIREGWDKLPPTERFGDRGRHFLALDKPQADMRVFSPTLNADLKLPSYASAAVSQIPGTQRAASIVAF